MEAAFSELLSAVDDNADNASDGEQMDLIAEDSEPRRYSASSVQVCDIGAEDDKATVTEDSKSAANEKNVNTVTEDIKPRETGDCKRSVTEDREKAAVDNSSWKSKVRHVLIYRII